MDTFSSSSQQLNHFLTTPDCKHNSKMKTVENILGLILLWACVVGKGKAQESLSDNEVDQVFSASENSLAALLASRLQQQDQQQAQKRMSLEDFFLNRNPQQNEVASAALPQLPEAQLQVQQPNPDSVVMVRDTNLPVVNGGMVSRLLLARRMLRLRRMIRRMLILPRILRLGRPLRPLRQVAAASPLRLFSKRIGQAYDDPYDPRDYVFGNKGYYDSNLASSQETSFNKNKQKQSFRHYDHVVDPYELPHDKINLEKEKTLNNYEINDGKYQNWNKQKQALNDVNVGTHGNKQAYDIQNIQEQLEILKKLQQQRNQPLSNYEESDKRPKYKSSQKIQPLSSQAYEDSPHEEEYESNHEDYNNPTDHKYDSQTNQQASNDYKQPSKAKEVDEQQLQLTREQILQLLQEQQLQILRDEQLKLQQLQQLQFLQQQQEQGYRQPQHYDNQQSHVESEDQGHSYHEEPYENQHQDPEVDEQHEHTNGHEAGDGEYENSQTVGTGLSSATPAGKKAIGIGVNVGVKPPGINIQITRPVSPVIKPISPIVKPIIKPVAPKPVEEALVPIGFLPKPILKLNGRLFFGAEAGKGVTVG